MSPGIEREWERGDLTHSHVLQADPGEGAASGVDQGPGQEGRPWGLTLKLKFHFRLHSRDAGTPFPKYPSRSPLRLERQNMLARFSSYAV